MPSGYETRQGGRPTFASATPAAPQGRASFSGVSAGAQVVGGQSEGGVVGGDITTPGPIGGELGEFFGRIMEPHIQRRQKEDFIKGVTAQMSRQAGDEIRASSGGFSKIFGPSSYEEGAIFYSAKKAVNEWGTSMLNDQDNLKRMPPDELAKTVAASMDSLQTGDRFTDQAVQAAVFEASGPVLETIAKARYVWQQDEGSKAYVGSLESSGSLLQQTAKALAAMSAPSDKESSALAQMADNFRASAIKPAGMSDETYKKSLYNYVKGAAQSGNGYAAKTLMQAGLASVLDEEDAQKLEDVMDKYGKRAIADAANTPEMRLKIARVYEAEVKGKGSTGASIMDDLVGINETLKRSTGFDVDLFDQGEVTGHAKTFMQSVKSAFDRAEDRKWQIEDREDNQAAVREEKEREEAQTAAQVNAAYATGDIKTALAAKIGTGGDYNILAQNDYAKGEYGTIVRAYTAGSWVSSLVSEKMQTKVEQSLGGQYSDATKQAYTEWSALHDKSAAAAAAYYGKWNLPMTNFDNLTRGGMEPQIAFQRAFLNPAQYSSAQMPPAKRKAAGEAITAAVATEKPWGFFGYALPFQRTAINSAGQAVMKDALWDQVALLSQNSSQPMPVLIAQATQNLVTSGKVERYGAFVWRNKTGTKPLGELLNLKQQDADEVVMSSIDAKLKANGFSEGAYGSNYEVQRGTDGSGKPVLMVQALDDDAAHPITAYISYDYLKTAAINHVGSKVATTEAQPSKYNNVDAYRRIPGETTAQRVVRINREVKEGARPTQ